MVRDDARLKPRLRQLFSRGDYAWRCTDFRLEFTLLGARWRRITGYGATMEAAFLNCQAGMRHKP